MFCDFECERNLCAGIGLCNGDAAMDLINVNADCNKIYIIRVECGSCSKVNKRLWL